MLAKVIISVKSKRTTPAIRSGLMQCNMIGAEPLRFANEKHDE